MGEKVQIFERDYFGGRWYVLLPESSKTSLLTKILNFKWLSIKYYLDFSTH